MKDLGSFPVYRQKEYDSNRACENDGPVARVLPGPSSVNGVSVEMYLFVTFSALVSVVRLVLDPAVEAEEFCYRDRRLDALGLHDALTRFQENVARSPVENLIPRELTLRVEVLVHEK